MLWMGCMNNTEALRVVSPNVTSMSPRFCGTAVRSVRTMPASASTTTPVPREQITSPSSICGSKMRSMSKCCSVLKTTEQRLCPNSGATPVFRFLTDGSQGATSDTLEGKALDPCKDSGDHTRDLGSNVHLRKVYHWRCILTTLSHLRRSLALRGTIHDTLKCSLSGICLKSSSNLTRSGQASPSMARMTASDRTCSPKTKPACATYTPSKGMWCFCAVWYGTSWKMPSPTSMNERGTRWCRSSTSRTTSIRSPPLHTDRGICLPTALSRAISNSTKSTQGFPAISSSTSPG
mmetsp:Transcript_46241/g.122641  ORF Transcript_46241/g.122641 Transcript_46241/m.122641 type:complete len:292 (+) Transcript_46241:1360-2235(+)